MRFCRDVLGADVSEPEALPEHGVRTVFINLGNTKLELLHPLGPDSPIRVTQQPRSSFHSCVLRKFGSEYAGMPFCFSMSLRVPSSVIKLFHVIWDWYFFIAVS